MIWKCWTIYWGCLHHVVATRKLFQGVQRGQLRNAFDIWMVSEGLRWLGPYWLIRRDQNDVNKHFASCDCSFATFKNISFNVLDIWFTNVQHQSIFILCLWQVKIIYFYWSLLLNHEDLTINSYHLILLLAFVRISFPCRNINDTIKGKRSTT